MSEHKASKSKSVYKPKVYPNRFFVSNLDGSAASDALEEDVRKLFEQQTEVLSIAIKKNSQREYAYAFVEIKEGLDPDEIVKSTIGGRRIRVEIQKNGRRESRSRASQEGCFNCGRHGHFARYCRGSGTPRRNRRRGRDDSDSRSRERYSRHRRRHDSSSSDSDQKRKKGKSKHNIDKKRSHKSRKDGKSKKRSESSDSYSSN